MPYEIATLTIDPAEAAAFEDAVARCVALFRRAKGCRSMRLEREVEDPARYLLRVDWETIEDHTVHFRQSADFQQWRATAGPFFRGTPVVVHSETAARFF